MKELEKSQYDSYGEETKGKESIKQDKSAKEEEEDKSVENVYSSKSNSILILKYIFVKFFQIIGRSSTMYRTPSEWSLAHQASQSCPKS